MPQPRSPQKLTKLFAKQKVVDLPAIRGALGGASVQTAFRYLQLVPYRRSYNHNGRYYALYRACRFINDVASRGVSCVAATFIMACRFFLGMPRSMSNSARA